MIYELTVDTKTITLSSKKSGKSDWSITLPYSSSLLTQLNVIHYFISQSNVNLDDARKMTFAYISTLEVAE